VGKIERTPRIPLRSGKKEKPLIVYGVWGVTSSGVGVERERPSEVLRHKGGVNGRSFGREGVGGGNCGENGGNTGGVRRGAHFEKEGELKHPVSELCDWITSGRERGAWEPPQTESEVAGDSIQVLKGGKKNKSNFLFKPSSWGNPCVTVHGPYVTSYTELGESLGVSWEGGRNDPCKPHLLIFHTSCLSVCLLKT